MRLSIFNRHPRTELSAHLDGELIPLRVEAVQVHLASCPSCRAELEALRQLKAGLAALPETPARRSFALTPEMVARPPREPAVVPARARALANGMRLAGAVMTVALVFVLVLDFTGGGTKGGDSSTAANPQQIAALPNSDSLSRVGDNLTAPTPAPDHSDLGSAPTALPGGSSSGNGPSSGIPPSPGIAQGFAGGAPSPAVAQTDESGSANKSAGDITEGAATNAPATLNAEPSDFGAQPASASTGSGGGVDVLLIVALALATGIVLTVAASFVLPRLGRGDV